MKILILNVGSSSVKFEVFEKDKSILKGMIERINSKQGFCQAIIKIMGVLEKNRINVNAVGHRVVHGGLIGKTSRIDSKLIKKLDEVKNLAPLHNIPEINTIKICLRLFKERIPQFAVFDTAFHHTIPERAYTYAIPYKITEKYRIRRYGFHGTSHRYVAEEACRKLGKNIKNQRIITCHLGNGCSITAVKNGKSIDTSMGFTPLEGLVMGTRSGDIDPAAITYLVGKGYSAKQLYDVLNYKSGLLGISGISNDLRDLLKSRNKRAKLAVDVFVYRIIKYIGAYAAAMNGVDILVFTAGIGENNAYIRNRVLKNLTHLRIKNVAVVKTDEAKQMAREISKIF